MIKLNIIEINKFNAFVLQDTLSKKKFNLVLEFQIDKQPQVGDCLTINEKLLNKQSNFFSNQFVFGDLKSPYGRNITDETDPDLAFIKLENKNLVLKRLYG